MKERLKSGAIAVLLVITVLLARQIWISPPPTGKKLIKASEVTLSESVTGRLLPFSAVVNFGGGKHTKLYQLKNLWPFYRNLLKQNIADKDDKQWARMDYKEYLKLHDEPSVVFDLGNDTYSDLFKKIYNIDDLKGKLLRIYFSEADGILFETDRGVYRTEKWTPLSAINQYIRTLKKEHYPAYTSLWERYGIARAVYLPEGTPHFEGGMVYRNEIKDMKGPYRTDLVQRLLSTSIDDIHVIREEDSVLYVYGKRNVRLSDNGMLDYHNNSDTAQTVTDAAGALQVAYEFLAKTTGNIDDLYMQRIEPIGSGKRTGFRVVMDFTEKGMTVFPLKGKPADFIELEIYNNRVEHLRSVYRNKVEGLGGDVTQEGLPFEEIMKRNPAIFGTAEEGYDKTLKNLNNFFMCYIDDTQSDEKPLRYGYVIDMGDERYIFDGESGVLVGGDEK